MRLKNAFKFGQYLLVLLYDKTTRKVFGMIVGVGIVVIGGWLFYELIYWPYKYR